MVKLAKSGPWSASRGPVLRGPVVRWGDLCGTGLEVSADAGRGQYSARKVRIQPHQAVLPGELLRAGGVLSSSLVNLPRTSCCSSLLARASA